MIKRKKLKKPKIKKRKNPKLDEIPLTDQEISDLKWDLRDALIKGNARELANAIQISKIGEFCTDCKRITELCKCEYCDDCGFNKCLCKWDINNYTYQDTLFENKVRRAAWKFAKEIFSEKELKEFKTDLLNRINQNIDYGLYNFLKYIAK